MNRGIQELRAVAALIVLLQHAVYLTGVKYPDLDLTGFLRHGLGLSGVYLFFCVSGFIMAGKLRDRPAAFLAHRLCRIYPSYWIAVALSLALQAILLAPHRIRIDLASLTLFPTGRLNNTLAIPYWTLVYEVFFYAICFLFTLVRGRFFWSFLGIWMVVLTIAGGVGAFQLDGARPSWAGIAFSPYDFGFIFGALVRGVGDRDLLPARAIAPLAAITGCALLLDFGQRSWAQVFFAMSALIYLVLPVSGGRVGGLLARIGDWSYGLYLVHFVIIEVTSSLLVAAGLPFGAVVGLSFAVALAIGCLYGAFDTRLYAALKSRVDRRLPRRAV